MIITTSTTCQIQVYNCNLSVQLKCKHGRNDQMWMRTISKWDYMPIQFLYETISSTLSVSSCSLVEDSGFKVQTWPLLKSLCPYFHYYGQQKNNSWQTTFLGETRGFYQHLHLFCFIHDKCALKFLKQTCYIFTVFSCLGQSSRCMCMNWNVYNMYCNHSKLYWLILVFTKSTFRLFLNFSKIISHENSRPPRQFGQTSSKKL